MGLTLRIIIFLIFARNFQDFRFLVIICLILGVFNVFLIKLRYGAFKFSVLNWSLLYLSYYFYYFFFFFRISLIKVVLLLDSSVWVLFGPFQCISIHIFGLKLHVLNLNLLYIYIYIYISLSNSFQILLNFSNLISDFFPHV